MVAPATVGLDEVKKAPASDVEMQLDGSTRSPVCVRGNSSEIISG